MGKSKIEWLKNADGTQGYSINPIKGICPMDCKDNDGKSYCYARKLYKRFNWNPEIRLDAKSLSDAIDIGKPSRIFVGSTMELFGDWVKPSWLNFILKCCELMPEHTFIFLTKCPQNLPIKFPPNCWVGFSATNQMQYNAGICGMAVIKASVKFVSFEPLLQPIHPEGAYDLSELNWAILGSRTQPTRHPSIIWVDEIISAADKVAIPVFVKEPMASHFGIRRQEFPVGVKQCSH